MATDYSIDEMFSQAIAHFNRHEFFESHDVLEELWAETRGANKLFYQGIIQIAVGFYHLQNANKKGALSLLERGIAKVSQYPDHYHGIDVAMLARESTRCMQEIQAAELGALPLIAKNAPTIDYSAEESESHP